MATLISRAPAPRRYRTFEVAIVLSLLLHLTLGLLYRDYFAQIARVMRVQTAPKHTEVVTSTTIRIEKKTIPVPMTHEPTPVVKQQQQPTIEQPKTVVKVEHTTVARAPKPDVAKPHPVQERHHRILSKPDVTLPKVAYAKPVEGTTSEHSDFKKQSANIAGAPRHGTATYSQQDLQQLNSKFAHTIAATRDTTDLAPVQVKTPAVVHRSSVSFDGVEGDLRPGQGYIHPILEPQYKGAYVFYYCHIRFMWPDGHVEDDDVPWPYVFPRNHDLFAMRVTSIPPQGPPANYVPNQAMPPLLQEYFPNLYPNAPNPWAS